MKNLCLVLMLSLLGSCSLLKRTPAQQLAQLVTAHPELARSDTLTITVHDTVAVPRVEVQTRYVAVPNPGRARRDSLALDSLLNRLSASLDTAQHKAAKARIYNLLRARPAFPDTLCFDTLGMHGRIWQRGSTYFIRLTRDEINTPHTAQGKAAYQRLTPCHCPAPIWYDPRTWPYRWLLAGLLGGFALCLFLRRS